MAIDVRASFDAEVSDARLFEVIRNLATYPLWLDIVHFAEPSDSEHGFQSWNVELRAKIGPFARSKRLRMVRTTCDTPNQVVFERQELDSRRHSAWILRAKVTSTATGAMLETNLHYSGSLFTGGVLERALADQINAGSEKLIQRLSAK